MHFGLGFDCNLNELCVLKSDKLGVLFVGVSFSFGPGLEMYWDLFRACSVQ